MCGRARGNIQRQRLRRGLCGGFPAQRLCQFNARAARVGGGRGRCDGRAGGRPNAALRCINNMGGRAHDVYDQEGRNILLNANVAVTNDG
jgi:hypothetical protein